jgi:hypothetical protein
MIGKSSRKRKKEKDDSLSGLMKLEGKKKKLEYHKEQLGKIVRGVMRGLLDVKYVETVLDNLNEYLEKNEVDICIYVYMCFNKIIYLLTKGVYIYIWMFICLLCRIITHKKKIYMSY